MALLEAGLTRTNENGLTPLGAANIIVALLEAGADPNSRAVDGKIPWDMIPEDRSEDF